MRSAGLSLIVAAASLACANASTSVATPSPATAEASIPTFSPPAGTYASAQTVTIASATPGATIRCTRDGTAPTAASPACPDPILVASTTTLRALATAEGYRDSEVATGAFTINPGATPTAAPTFSPDPATTYVTSVNVTISSATPGATIHCTTNGAVATAASPTCTSPLAIGSSTTIRAVATAPGHTVSPESRAAYRIQGSLPAVAAPTFSPPGGAYAASLSVHVSTTTPGATLHCTTDGSDPTPASPVCADPIAVSSTVPSTTLKAIGTAPGWSNSVVSSARYVFGTASGTQVAGGTIGADTVWGIAGSPYHVNGNLLVAQGAKLTVQAGVEVIFTGHYALDVCGQLDARGTAPTQRDVVFTAVDRATGWAGIRIHGDNYSGNDSAGPRGSPTLDQYLENCIVEYANKSTGDGPLGGNYANQRGGALWAYEQRKLHLNGNLFRFCKSDASVTGDFGDGTGAVTIFYNHSATEAVFADNDFEDNWSYGPGGAFSVYHSSPNAAIAGMGIRLLRGSFKRNVAVNNPYSIYPFYAPPGTSTPSIGGAVASYDSDIVLENVTLGTGADANTQGDYAWAHTGSHTFTILTTP